MKRLLYIGMAMLMLSLPACASEPAGRLDGGAAGTNTAAASPAPDAGAEVLLFDAAYNGLPVLPYGDMVYSQRYVAALDAPKDGVWEIVALDAQYEYVQTIGSNVTRYASNAFYAGEGIVYATSGRRTDCIDAETNEIVSYFEGTVRHIDYDAREVYYTAASRDGMAGGLFAMGFDETTGRKAADASYTFVAVQDGVFYLSETNADNEVILYTLRMDTQEIKELVVLSSMNWVNGDSYVNEVQTLKLCGDRIVLTYGSLQGSGGFYYGRLASLKTDGSDLVEASFEEASDAASFEVAGDALYISTAYGGVYGMYRMSADLATRELVLPECSPLESNGELLLYAESVEEGTGKQDLYLYDAGTGASRLLIAADALPVFDGFSYMLYGGARFCGDSVYCTAYVNAYTEGIDSWRGHTAYEAGLLIRLDGSEIVKLGEAFYDEPVSIGS